MGTSIRTPERTDPGKTTAAIAATKDRPGVTGTTTIHATHEAEKPIGIIRVENGKQIFHAIVDAPAK